MIYKQELLNFGSKKIGNHTQEIDDSSIQLTLGHEDSSLKFKGKFKDLLFLQEKLLTSL